MRKTFSVALMAAIVCLVGMTRDASALVTFNLVWTATTGTGAGAGTNTIAADIGDTLTLEIRMTNNQRLGAHGISLNFDTDLGNELNLLIAKEWTGSSYGASNYSPTSPGTGSTVESTGGIAGRINLYESGQQSGPAGLPTTAGYYVIGTAKFVANGALNAQGDGFDVFSGLFTMADAVLNNDFDPISSFGTPTTNVVFNNASVTSAIIPEPATASLLGLGLVGLVLAGRRSRRS